MLIPDICNSFISCLSTNKENLNFVEVCIFQQWISSTKEELPSRGWCYIHVIARRNCHPWDISNFKFIVRNFGLFKFLCTNLKAIIILSRIFWIGTELNMAQCWINSNLQLLILNMEIFWLDFKPWISNRNNFPFFNQNFIIPN